MKFRTMCAALLMSCVFSPLASADYASMNIDGLFGDWASVSVLATDAADITGAVDFTQLQVANDENFVYYRFQVDGDITSSDLSSIFTAVDEDNDIATGFNVFGLGVIGSEAGWQGDFPFQQGPGAGDFNTGSLTSGINYATSLFVSGATPVSSVEVAIDRTTFHTAGGAPVFGADGDTIGILLYTTIAGSEDTIGGTSYTLMAPPVTVPEPGSIALFATGILGLAARRRRR